MNRSRLLLLTLLSIGFLARADVELPRVYALTNARIVPAPGKLVERGTIVVRQGLIESVGSGIPVPKDAVVVDLSGRTIYPGLIDPFVRVNRLSGASPRGQHPEEETGETLSGPTGRQTEKKAPALLAQHKVVESLEIRSDVREEFLSLGFTVVAAVPERGVFRGQGALVSLGDGDLEKTVIQDRAGQVVVLDPVSKKEIEEAPVSKMGMVAFIRQTILDAKWWKEASQAYAANPSGKARPEFRQSWAAFADAASGQEPVFFETPGVLALLRAAGLARDFNLKARYVGASDAYLLADEVKAARPDLILTLDFPRVPAPADDDAWLDVTLPGLRAWDRAPSNPYWMRQMGLNVALTTHGLTHLDELPSRLQKVRSRGFSADDLLAAFTTVPAAMYGVSNRIGELAPGRIANLVVVKGRLFEKGSRVVETWIDGFRHEVRQKETLPSGTFLVEGLRLEFKKAQGSKPATLIVGEKAQPVGLTAREDRYEFEADGALFLLAPGPVSGTATLDGLSLLVRLADRKGEAVIKRGEKEPPLDASTQPADATEESSTSDVRPLPQRFARPLAEPRAVLVRNATVWTSGPSGKSVADLLVLDGKVSAVGKDLAIPQTVAASSVEIDGTGKHLTAGLIDCHSHTALDGDVNEYSENISADVRTSDVLDPFDPAIYWQLAGGLTTFQALHGSANAIGGQSTVVKLKYGSGPEKLVLEGAPAGIKFALGENPKGANAPGEPRSYPQTRMGVSALIRQRFQAALDYRERQKAAEAARKAGQTPMPVRTDLELDAIAEILEGKRRIHSHAYVKQEILDLIRLCEEFGVKIGTFQHALDAYKVADEIAAHGAGASVFSDWWAYKFEVYDAIPYNASILKQRDVTVSYNSDSDELARRLGPEAGKAVKYGNFTDEEALALVTANPATQLGIAARTGSLEAGKDADFVLWSGSPLDPASAVLETWIEGKKYFDRAEDLRTRELLDAEKEDLITLARKALARGEASREPDRPKRPRHGCLDGREGEVH
ncbi:MAG: amidohydrolase family protein [Thermoanaerobaculia bacterium]|nr:amidohydrolase family protein [Thermoanaerobaculia bacterium]